MPKQQGASIIEVQNLTKVFGGSNGDNVVAVDDLSFLVKTGEIFGFCGENGAGKSTTISCITTLLEPTSGTIKVAGNVLGSPSADDKVRQKIGVVFQKSVLDENLTAKENLESRGKLYGIKGAQLDKRIEELSVLLGLGEFLERRYGKLSGGQKRRADIARALLHSPEILFLDEPTTGLDPYSRSQVWKTVQDLRDKYGLTVFLTTHYMEETENADNVVIIDHGKIRAEGTPSELRAKYSRDILKVTSAVSDVANPQTQTIEVRGANEALNYLEQHRADITDFEFRHGTMDDVFLNLTSNKNDQAEKETESEAK